MPRCSTMPAACSTRSSSPSGSTMCRRSERARSISMCSKRSGVITSDVGRLRRRTSSAASTCCSNSASAAAYFCGESAARRLRAWVMRTAVSNVPRSFVAIGSVAPEPVEQLLHGRRDRETAVQDEARQRRERLRQVRHDGAEHDLADRSAGTTTIAPSVSRGSTLSTDIAATTVSRTGRSSPASSPEMRVASRRGQHVAQQRSGQLGVLGQRPARSTATLAISASAAGSARLTMVASSAACSALSSSIETRARPARSARRPERARLGAAAEHQQHGRGEVRGDARVRGELGRGSDVGVVRAEDHDGVAGILHRTETVHDLGERGIRILMQLGIGGADAGVVLELGAGVLEQHLEHVVAIRARCARSAGTRPTRATEPFSVSSSPTAIVDLPVPPSAEVT